MTCKWWAEHGLALYGQRAAREEAVEDFIKRRNRAPGKTRNASFAWSACLARELQRAG